MFKISLASRSLFALLVCGSSLAVAVEPVATVLRVQGIGLVNQGADYTNVLPGTVLRQGDRLMAMEGGSLELKFNDGCIYKMLDNEILTVGSAMSCSDGSMASAKVGPYLAAAPGAAAGLSVFGLGAGASAGLIAAGVLGTVVVVGAATDTGSDSRTEFPAPAPQPISP